MDTSVKNVHAEKINFGTSCLIEEEALQMGLEAFFAKHTYNFTQPKGYRTLRDFARAAACNLPDYCSFDAFFAKFRDRFAAWYETGNFYGIADDPAEE
jgi:4-alpha-glucanotransferase